MSSKTPRSRRKSKLKAARKTRTKTRSLQKDFSASTNSPESVESTQQLNLFPLHPEEKEDANVAYFFDTEDSATLNGLIWRNTISSGGGGCAVSSEEESLCRSYADHSEEVTGTTTTTTSSLSLLERSALRGNIKTDLSEEKWVCYEEVTSCVPEYWKKPKTEEDCGGGGGGSLLLKLDYDEIMNAWSDKGPLYIDGVGEGCQIVPDMLDDVLRQDTTNGLFNTGNVPTLPNDAEVSKMGLREASVLRYKEKRQNRLFAKRIRYEVRKLNAEKRPRMKGRFVKRSED